MCCYIRAKKKKRGRKVELWNIPSNFPWSMSSNYSELIFSAWLIPKWIKCGPYYCRPGAPLKRVKKDQGCGLWCQSGSDPEGLRRWRYAVRVPWHLLVACLFRAHLHKSKRPIALEEVSFHLRAKRRRWKTFPTTTLWLLTLKSASRWWVETV